MHFENNMLIWQAHNFRRSIVRQLVSCIATHAISHTPTLLPTRCKMYYLNVSVTGAWTAKVIKAQACGLLELAACP